MLPNAQELNTKTRHSVYQRFPNIFNKIESAIHIAANQGLYSKLVFFSETDMENAIMFVSIEGIKRTDDGKIYTWLPVYKLFDELRDCMIRDTDIKISGYKTVDGGYEFSFCWSDEVLVANIDRCFPVSFNEDDK